MTCWCFLSLAKPGRTKRLAFDDNDLVVSESVLTVSFAFCNQSADAEWRGGGGDRTSRVC